MPIGACPNIALTSPRIGSSSNRVGPAVTAVPSRQTSVEMPQRFPRAAPTPCVPSPAPAQTGRRSAARRASDQRCAAADALAAEQWITEIRFRQPVHAVAIGALDQIVLPAIAGPGAARVV